MDFVPDTAAKSGLDFEPEANPDAIHIGAAPSPEDLGVAPANQAPAATKAKPTVGAGKAFARGAVAGGTFGLFSVLNSAADQAGQKLLPQSALDFIQQHGGGGEGLPINEPHTFDERRAAYQELQHQAQAQHPVAFGVGEAAGTIAAPLPGASGLGAAVTEKAGGKLLGKIAGTAAEAGLYGGASAAGNAVGEGKTAPDAAVDFGKGALAGAVTGAALHGVAGLTGMVADKALKSLSDKYVQLFGAEIAGGTAKSTKANFAALAGREDKAGIKAAENYIKSPDLAPVEKAAAGGFYGEALDRINDQVQKLSPQRQANYGLIKDAKEFRVGDGLDSIRNQQFIARNSGSKGAPVLEPLAEAEKAWINDFSTADADRIQQLLETKMTKLAVTPEVSAELAAISDNLPNEGRISRDQWLKAGSNASPEAKAYLTQLESLEQGSKKVPNPLFKWDPNATTDPLRLRAEASSRAEQASAGLNSLTPQFAAVRKQAVSKAINGALEKYLDQVAETGQDAAAAVRRIRADDVKWNVLLTAKSALKQKLDKQQVTESTQEVGKFKQPHLTLLGAGLMGAGAAYKTGIRNAPRLQQSLANLPQSSPLSTALAGRAIPAAARFAAGQATAPPAPAPPPPVATQQPTAVTGTTQLGTAQ